MALVANNNMYNLNRKSMHPRLKFFLQTRVDQTVTSKRLYLMCGWKKDKYQQKCLANLVELWTDNHHLEVCLTSLGHIVHVGLVDNLDRKYGRLF